PWKAYPLKIGRAKARVITENGRTAIALDGASAGPFEGEIRFTFYPGGRLVRAAAILSTQRESSAILFDTGLVAQPESPAPWQSIAWTNLSDKVARMPAGEVAGQNEQQIKVRHRTIIAEGENGGSVALVPPPHQYFYPLDSVDNLASTWVGRNYRQLIDGPAFGVRQTVEGDKRWVPWMNAPPGTKQDLGVFYLLSDGDATAATADALAYTHNDTFVPLDGYKTFSSHYHVEHAVDYLNQQKAQATTGIPKGLETPPFVKRFRDVGLNIAHLAEFHLGDGDMKVADRLTRLKTLHDECARLSDTSFLMVPGEEPNVHLGGHWLSFFAKPVYWTLGRKADQPFVEQDAKYGTVYHVGSPADVLKLMETENGLMWTAHPRIKASTNYPDIYKDEAFFKSDHFLGGAWKAMPADCSLPRLGTRVLDLLDDMNNWGAHKQAPGEVDVFKIDADSELYAHMNVNYLKLTDLPAFANGWQPVLDTLRAGQFFTTTGEVLIPTFTIDGQSSGQTISPPAVPSRLRASLRWTFPLAFAELVSGDGQKTYRQRIDLSDTIAFGTRDINVEADLRGKTWARFEVWDIAANGAYTQPVWIK
ncbi:MAG: uncharacterized protein JWM57_2304, partial [Phycisphaerales bacterium]|nr:uncharacterized protein [Phycisphaerales bacterium]